MMIEHFNLLPWRVYQKRKNKRLFLTEFGISAVILLSIFILINWKISGQIFQQKRTIAYLSQTSEILQKRLKEINRIKTREIQLKSILSEIDILKKDRFKNGIFLYKLANNIPNEMYILQIDRVGNSYQLLGKSQSNKAISSLAQSLLSDKYFNHFQIKEINISATKNKYTHNFVLNVGI